MQSYSAMIYCSRLPVKLSPVNCLARGIPVLVPSLSDTRSKTRALYKVINVFFFKQESDLFESLVKKD